jgi:glycosyltransferase involved in cell wall biosynthesis
MLIGIDASRALLSQRTGTENYSLHLIRALLRLDSGHRFRLYLRQRPPDDLWPASANAELQVIPWARLWTHLRLSWEMARRPPDLLFVPAHVLPLLHPRRSVVTVHDLGYLHYPEAHPFFDRLYLDLSTRYHCRAAAHIIAVSQATKDDLVRCYRADPRRITVIHSAHAAGLFRPADPAAQRAVRERYVLHAPYLLYLGTLQPRKNLARLLEAFAKTPRRLSPEAQPEGSGGLPEGVQPLLVIAGKKGWLYEPLFQQVERLGLSGRVVFTGYVPEEDLPPLLSGALALVLPSLYEGFGLPLLEAMACGTPVICSNASALPEIAGDAALLIDPLDAADLAEGMARLVEDEELRRRLVARGLERAAQFSWERCARETLAVLEEVAAHG